jgi:hypothetical protein
LKEDWIAFQQKIYGIITAKNTPSEEEISNRNKKIK